MAGTQRVLVWPASLESTTIDAETHYKLRGDAGIIVRAAWWALERLNALEPYIPKSTEWIFVPHKQRDLFSAVSAAVNDQSEMVADGKAVIIMGGSDFSKLTSSPEFGRSMMFVLGPFYRDDPYGGLRMFDVPIHVVPQMTGFAVVPKVIVEASP